MSSGGMIANIKDQINRGVLKSEQAILYVLELQMDLVKKYEDADVRFRNLEQSIDNLSRKLDNEIERRNEQDKYTPSLLWLAANKTKYFILIVTSFTVFMGLVLKIADITGVTGALVRMLGF